MKRAIITGPTGTIGSALCDVLIQNNYEVYAICRVNSSNIKKLKKSENLKVIECNLDSISELSEKLDKDFDVFFHLAWGGTIGEGRNNPQLQLDNVKYTLDALLLAQKLGCTVFIGAGSQAEYGHFLCPPDEKTVCKPFTLYGASKLAAGHISRIYAEQLGIKHIWTRIFSVYGPNDDENTLISYVINELSNKRVPKLTKCEQIWDYLYSYDAAKALFLLSEKGKDGKTYCIGSGKKRVLKDYVLDIKNIIDPKLKIDFGAKTYGENQVMFLSADISDLENDTEFKQEYSFDKGIRSILKCRGDN